ncbi:aspartate carbamoyltransferase [Aerococcus kribbianus]|uniref:Aspartate carbamoyltransferase n=1 Tax=Aerococcus kribbianus TaxID=2999064 RepID=A0A9X3FMD8_9LACT|nr:MULTISPECIES: aspartate carbamoyltransferase [unclassified Aerococcus]MCZ0717150.1 aspartate carbamoyltransferase [Aerococcus sp. YH-aer221]MCZ0725438.1 aspartate carbamoyltransferase [Aerococcus sp. YH-aer222]
MQTRHLINISDFTRRDLDSLLSLAQQIIKSPKDFSHLCDGKILGTLFFEPSTRTRLSFESAMNRLGGSVIGIAEAASSSTTKGESLADTIRTVSAYTDIMAMRHPLEGAATLASQTTQVPLINAGDGGHQHPTQTLSDLLTILETRGQLNGQTIALCGDLKFGRTVHSLISALSLYPDNRFILVSPEELQLPTYIKQNLSQAGIPFQEEERLENVLDQVDVLYMTRVQKERFFNEADYVRLKDSYILDNDKLKDAKEDLAILHPLPRVNEIQPEVDSDPRAKYFDQVGYGVIVRMALIITLLGLED